MPPHRRPNWAPLFRGMGNQTSEAFAYIEREYKDVKGRIELQRRVGGLWVRPLSVLRAARFEKAAQFQSVPFCTDSFQQCATDSPLIRQRRGHDSA